MNSLFPVSACLKGLPLRFHAEDDNHFQHEVLVYEGDSGGRRLIANTWTGNWLLRQLSIPTTRLVPALLRPHSNELRFGKAIGSGPHLAVSIPVPIARAVYDILPAKFYDRLNNRPDFLKIFIVDALFGLDGYRHAVFHRTELGFTALFTRCDRYFQRRYPWWWPAWVTYINHKIYSLTDAEEILASTISRISQLSTTDLLDEVQSLPAEWTQCGDWQKLASAISLISARLHSRPVYDALLHACLRELKQSMAMPSQSLAVRTVANSECSFGTWYDSSADASMSVQSQLLNVVSL